MDTFLILTFFILVIFFGLFYGSRKALALTLISLVVTEVYVMTRIIVSREDFIIPGAILGVFLAGYFLFIFNLIRYYIKKNENQYNLFLEYYNDAVKKYDMLSQEAKVLKEENVRVSKELDTTISYYENIKSVTATLDFTNKLELMTRFIHTLAQFSEGQLVLAESKNNELQIEKVFNMPVGDEPRDTFVYEADEVVHKNLYNNIMSAFEDNADALFVTKGEMTQYISGDDKEYETFGAVPLVSENELLGYVVVFDVDIIGFEKIQNLAPQLANELKKINLYHKVRDLSIIDGLTGLYLRRHFVEILETEVDRANRNKQPLSFFIADIDNFKHVNDKYGHLAGDILLREVSGILKDEARSVDLIGRYGGDEIAIALPKTDLNIAIQVAERMRLAVKAHNISLEDDEVTVTLSIGISSYPYNCGSLQDMIDKADEALYKAKQSGKDKVCVWGINGD
ncbi:MAG: GGDEF domain-containing protein [Candidatus Ancaeobacter aquaticus]|nr:GGDEF domain-containing protein [Candidatus Ancaeobacter aquaticus]